jgi:hypothetical protein
VRTLWDAHQQGVRNHAHHLWALMMLELWHRLFVDRSPGDVPSGIGAAPVSWQTK